MLVDIQRHLYRQVEVDVEMVRGWNCRLMWLWKLWPTKIYRKRNRRAQNSTNNYWNNEAGLMRCSSIITMDTAEGRRE